jgi:hypothetical protein
MTTYQWKITDISAEDELITHAKYHVTATSDDQANIIESEGNWWFSDKIVKKSFNQITELDVAQWIEKESIIDGKSSILSALDKQIDSLQNSKKANMPWKPAVFKVNI